MDVCWNQIGFFPYIFFMFDILESIEAVLKNLYTYRSYNYPCHKEQFTCCNTLNIIFFKQYVLTGPKISFQRGKSISFNENLYVTKVLNR